MSAGATGAAMAGALLAAGPGDDPSGRLATFGQLVGTWDVDVVYYLEDGSTETWPGEWCWAWILDGRAIQDVWRVPPRGAGSDAQDLPRGFGTTVRLYDPTPDAWHVTWFGAIGRTAMRFRARDVGGEIIMEALDAVAQRTRWIFSEIGSASFRWRNVSSTDDGATWDLEQEMTARRRSPAPAGPPGTPTAWTARPAEPASAPTR